MKNVKDILKNVFIVFTIKFNAKISNNFQYLRLIFLYKNNEVLIKY